MSDEKIIPTAKPGPNAARHAALEPWRKMIAGGCFAIVDFAIDGVLEAGLYQVATGPEVGWQGAEIVMYEFQVKTRLEGRIWFKLAKTVPAGQVVVIRRIKA